MRLPAENRPAFTCRVPSRFVGFSRGNAVPLPDAYKRMSLVPDDEWPTYQDLFCNRHVTGVIRLLDGREPTPFSRWRFMPRTDAVNYTPPPCPSSPQLDWARTRSSPRSEPAVWGRCIAPEIRGLTASLPSRSFPNIFPAIRNCASASSARPGPFQA
jgi:hypothetical protein